MIRNVFFCFYFGKIRTILCIDQVRYQKSSVQNVKPNTIKILEKIELDMIRTVLCFWQLIIVERMLIKLFFIHQSKFLFNNDRENNFSNFLLFLVRKPYKITNFFDNTLKHHNFCKNKKIFKAKVKLEILKNFNSVKLSF